jgi:hypothetical protein
MRTRLSRKRRTKAVTMMLAEEEFLRLRQAAGNHDLGPFCRSIVLGQVASDIAPNERIILGEICATRVHLAALLQQISDLNDSDIERSRADADTLRSTLVEQRVIELRGSRKVADHA